PRKPRQIIAARKPLSIDRPQRESKPNELPTELKSDRLTHPFRTGGNVFIRNATVLTGTGKTLKNTSLLIKNGKIAAIGSRLKPPQGIRVIDATGKYVIPGIIDTHSHIMIKSGVNEATQSIVPEVRIRDVINTDDVSEYRALTGGVTAARLFHGSANVIGGQDAVVKLKYGKTAAEHLVPNAPQGVKFALGENVKFRRTRFPNTRLGVEATLKRAFLEAVDYRRRWQEYRRQAAALKGKPNQLLPPRRDLRLEALADIVNHEKFIHSHCYRADEILMLLRVASDFGIRVWSLQHVLEGYKIAPEILAHGASCSTFADWWAYKVEAYDAIPHNAALLQEAGVNIVIKSDDRELMRHLYLEAAKTVRYGGMRPDHALQTITLNPARELGLDKRIGSIEVGKDADVAIFNGHPLNAFSRCEMTLIEGEVYFSRHDAPTAMSKSAAKRSQTPPRLRFPSPAIRKRNLDMRKSRNGRYAITNATLHPVDGPDIPRGTILIDKGRIAAIGKSVKIPAGTKIIDGKGLHVSPGFIDAGTTLGLTEIGKVRETHDYSESGLIQPDLRAGVALNRDSELIPVARAGGITAILVRPTGGVISGQASLARLAGWTTPEMIINLEAGLQINWPAGSRASATTKRLTSFFAQARRYDGIRTEAEKQKRRGPIVDPQLEAMRPYLHRQKPVFIEANSRKSIVEALLFAEKQKLRIVITGGAEAWKIADVLKKRNVPVIVALIPDPLHEMQQDEENERIETDRFLEVLDETLQEAGGKTMFVASSDLSHVGPQFGEPRPVNDQRKFDVERHDREMVTEYIPGDREEFLEAMRWHRNPTCW
ncbi:MAG: amidohydrolase family protein, partial [Planctomycetes bacterium]|nr:amidohydrolase family protein [Planctomycetota bacterium]